MSAAPTAVSVQSKPEVGSSILRRLLSFPVAVCALLSVLATLCVRDRFADPDMWWHLKMGQVIWTTHHIPTVDIFSYTTNHHAYIPHEWLSQLFMFSAYRLGGYSGLMLWLCGMTAAILIVGYTLCTMYSGNAKVALIGALTIFFFGTIGFSIRPQMIGYLLLLVELTLLHLGRTRDPRWFFGLPPTFALWVNCHGSFYFGLLVVAVVLLSSFFDFQAGSIRSVRWEFHRRRALGIAFLLSIIALLANPIGIRLVLYPAQILFHSPVNLSVVTEWLPLRMNDPRGLGFLLIVTGIPLFAAWGKGNLYLQELLLLAVSGFEAAEHERLLFVFGLIAAPVLARLLANEWPGYERDRDNPLANGLLIGASVCLAYLFFPGRANIAGQIEQQNPSKALAYIQQHDISGAMLNEYIFGGYLIWAAPEHPVFVDGRTDIFEWTGVLSEYGQAVLLQTSPKVLLDKYHISFCLLSRDSPLKQVLPLLPEWRIVYSDDVAFVAVRTPAAGPR